MYEKELQELYKLASDTISEVKNNPLLIDKDIKLLPLRITWNNSLKSTSARITCPTFNKLKPIIIELSLPCFQIYGMESMKKSLLHELAHYFCWILARNLSHDDYFKAFCCAIGGSMNCGLAKGEFKQAASKDYLTKRNMNDVVKNFHKYDPLAE